MVFKTTGFTAVIAAIAFTTFAGAEGSGANAQVAAQATADITTEAQLTEEVVPVFVEKEVVQELPAAEAVSDNSADAAPQADSLRELVDAMPAGSQLSDELQCLAGAVYFESRGEPLDGQLAVAQVIINRAEDRRFPSSYCSVVYQRAQFSFVKHGRMPRIKTGSRAWQRAHAIARIAHRGLWDSEASDALYFHANYVRPSWSRRKVALATIDTHVFYR
ncbi:MAG: cell wall hydrolase [Qipengyuania sp.]